MKTTQCFAIIGLIGGMALAPSVQAQTRSYIGYVYPAGGQQGTTLRIRLGCQGVEGSTGIVVSGSGVTAKIVEYHRRLNPQDSRLLNEQLQILRKGRSSSKSKSSMMMYGEGDETAWWPPSPTNMIERIRYRLHNWMQQPACASIADLVYAEITIAPNAEPGERELRLVRERGLSNPLPFYVGQVPEVSNVPMKTCPKQILGKENLALRKRPTAETEKKITVPCTVNGQIASGEVNAYRFSARKGQRLVISTLGRQLIPYLADAVPGWIQPVLALYDANGKELAYDDDYRFKPDPMIFFDVPADGEYVFSIRDAIYRGREDFIYRITIGEMPTITSIFPLGGPVGEPHKIQMKGWNLENASLTPPGKEAIAGIHLLTAKRGGLVSNRVPFMLDTLPECFEKESNDEPTLAQKVTLPIIINGRVDKTDDWDIFQFTGKANETIVAEVYARRLDSPVDSLIKLTDAKGELIAYSDDREDLGDGLNTHHADSYFMAKLPADGVYYVHLGDTGRKGGDEYAYRLRLSAPRPDFALRVAPSSVNLAGKSSSSVSVYVIRKDGFNGSIKLQLKNPPAGISAYPVTLTSKQEVGKLSIKADSKSVKGQINLTVEGIAKVEDAYIAHDAVPAEDRMQAFLWRHLVPSIELKATVFDPNYEPPAERPHRTPPPKTAVDTKEKKSTGTFTKQQVSGRLRQLENLFQQWLLTDEFYEDKVAECEAVQ